MQSMNESEKLRVTCPSCSKRLRVKASLERKRVKCPACSNSFEAKPGDVRPVETDGYQRVVKKVNEQGRLSLEEYRSNASEVESRVIEFMLRSMTPQRMAQLVAFLNTGPGWQVFRLWLGKEANRNLKEADRRSARWQRADKAPVNMGIGSVVCIIGLILTGLTYSAAQRAQGGGTYMVFWGAIVFGGIQFVIGCFQWVTSSKEV